MSKGSARRPTAITHEENEIRWKLAEGRISFDEFERRYKALARQGKTKRRF